MEQEEEMEKRGVVCKCAERESCEAEDMTKTASGYVCSHCGRPCIPEKTAKNKLDKPQ